MSSSAFATKTGKEWIPSLLLPLLETQQENTLTANTILDLTELLIKILLVARLLWASEELMRRSGLLMIVIHFILLIFMYLSSFHLKEK